MLTHKEVDAFIRKYNKEVIIKRYSSKRLKDKIALVERRMKESKSASVTEARLEWGKMKRAHGMVDEGAAEKKAAFFKKKQAEIAAKSKSETKTKPKVKVVAVVKNKSGG